MQDGEDLSSAAPPEFAAIFNPENSLFTVMLHDEGQLILEFLGAADKIQDFTGLLRQSLQLREHAYQGVHDCVIFVAVLLQEPGPVFKSEPAFAFRQPLIESCSMPAQIGQPFQHSSRDQLFLSKSGFNVAGQLIKAQVAYALSKVLACDVLKLMRLIEDDGREFRQDTHSIGIFKLDPEISEKQMMVHDDDVALQHPAAHLGNEAAVPLRTFLSGAALRAGIQLVP